MNLWADNVMRDATGDLAGDIVIEDGRARGTVKMTKPGDFFDKSYTFAVSFDVDVLGAAKPAAPKSDVPAGGLVADSHNGLPFPEGGEGFQSEGSQFRKQTSKTITADLKSVVDFYRRELASPDWTENKLAAKVEKASASLSFTGPSGGLEVQLKSAGDQTTIRLVSRDAQAAKQAGIFPPPGKGRLMIGNVSDNAITIAINKKDYNIAAKAGANDPKTGLNWEVAPGKIRSRDQAFSRKGSANWTRDRSSSAATQAWGLDDPANRRVLASSTRSLIRPRSDAGKSKGLQDFDKTACHFPRRSLFIFQMANGRGARSVIVFIARDKNQTCAVFLPLGPEPARR